MSQFLFRPLRIIPGDPLPKAIIVFDCPEHGLEVGSACFRAYDPRFRSCWKKFVLSKQEMSEEEISEILAS